MLTDTYLHVTVFIILCTEIFYEVNELLPYKKPENRKLKLAEFFLVQADKPWYNY